MDTGRSRVAQIALLLGFVIAAIAAGIAFLVPRLSDSQIAGPSQIESGEQAQYLLADTQGVLPWVRPDGTIDLTESLVITGRLPGEITISVAHDGVIHRRTVEVLPSPLGPKIEGPDRVDRGSSATWTAIAQSGDRIEWSTSTGVVGSGATFDFVAEDDFLLRVTAIDSSGVERGEQLSVSVG